MTFWEFFWHAVGVFGGVVIGGGVMALLALAAKADLRLALAYERHVAYCQRAVGNAMAKELDAYLRRKDLGAATRTEIQGLLASWHGPSPKTEAPSPEV